jgi:hypothetical protein
VNHDVGRGGRRITAGTATNFDFEARNGGRTVRLAVEIDDANDVGDAFGVLHDGLLGRLQAGPLWPDLYGRSGLAARARISAFPSGSVTTFAAATRGPGINGSATTDRRPIAGAWTTARARGGALTEQRRRGIRSRIQS